MLFSCNKTNSSTNSPLKSKTFAKTIKQVELKKYAVNNFSGDSISPLVFPSGDTIKTGVPVALTGQVKKITDFDKPVIISQTEYDTAVLANPNQSIISGVTSIKKISKNALFQAELKAKKTIKKSATSSRDNEYSTGIKIQCIQPITTVIKPPLFKDNATLNIQYTDVRQGLPSSYISSLLMDRKGNIWIGSIGGGLSCYDGITIKTYTVKNGLSDNNVRAIVEDNEGNFWIGTHKGLTFFDGKSFIHYTVEDGLTNNFVRSLHISKDGTIWIGTDGGGLNCFDGKTFTQFTSEEGLPSDRIWSITEDKSGNLWLGTGGGGVIELKFDKLDKAIESKQDSSFSKTIQMVNYTKQHGLGGNFVYSIYEDHKNNLWFGCSTEGLTNFIPAKQNSNDSLTFITYTRSDGLNNQNILSISGDSLGNLWLGTWGGGLIHYENKNGQEFFTQIDQKLGLNSDIIQTILHDGQGNLWLGTYGGGLNKYKVASFNHFNTEQGLSSDIIWSIFEDKDDNLWFGTASRTGGVICLKTEPQNHNEKSESLLSKFIHYVEKSAFQNWGFPCIFQDSKNNIWFGTSGKGVFCYNNETVTCFSTQQGLASNDVYGIMEDKKGNIWFATRNGLSYLQGSTFTEFTQEEGFINNYITNIIEDKHGNIWIATEGGGVSRYNWKNFVHYTTAEGLSSNTIWTILEDKKGNIWLGTDGGGLNVLTYSTELQSAPDKILYINTENGLSNNVIWSVIEDSCHRLWVSTESGLNLISINDQEGTSNITSFGYHDGLKGLDFFSNSAFLDRRNRLWWGSGKSLTMLDISNFKLSDQKPKVKLNMVKVNEEFIDFETHPNLSENDINFDSVTRFSNLPINLKVSYSKNHLTFFYSAIDLSAPHQLKYSHIIEGLNNKWSPESSEIKADYRNLPHGDYIFKVCAIGEGGVWSEPLEFHFTVLPPWWLTWYAKLSYLLILILIIYTFSWWRSIKFKRRQKELEIKVNVATHQLRNQNIEIKEQKEAVQNQKEIIEKAHNEILDSLAYAKRIQNAILPPLKIVTQHLENSFILYLPKDAVAGDFYWMNNLNNKTLFAVADCTGHGVPGALVSIMCNNALNRSVHEFGLVDPGEILNKTREIIISEFEQSDENVRDGMDIALCTIDNLSDKLSLKYAGAYNPLWIVNGHQLTEIKGNNQPIGIYYDPEPFITHSINLKPNDTLYIFSDGYADQFGGIKGKKLKKTAFKELLISIQNESMDEQKKSLINFFEEWKGENDQVDDVCIIGVRF